MLDSVNNKSYIPRQQINYLAKNYNTLEYTQALKSLLRTAFNNLDFSGYSKVMLHQLMNDSLIANYNGELSLKYQLFRRAAKKKVVAAFEIKVENSRVDFLTINGVTTSFEIKSELDNLGKLEKQVKDYSKVFEYNYVVVDARHKMNVIPLLPHSVGIIRFEAGNRITERPATLNCEIKPTAQLAMLTKKELAASFEKMTDRHSIVERFSNKQINEIFKTALKSRYSNRWNFLLKHQTEILPIDLQFFFNRNISPETIYNCG